MKLEDCLCAVIERHDDGTVLCPLLETGGSCEEFGVSVQTISNWMKEAEA